MDRLRQNNGFNPPRKRPLQLASMLRQLLGTLQTVLIQLPNMLRHKLDRLPTALIQVPDSMPKQLLDRLQNMPNQLQGRLLNILMQPLTQQDRLLRETRRKLLVFSNRFLPNLNTAIYLSIYTYII